MAFHFQEGTVQIPQLGFITLSCKHTERLQLHRACRESLSYEKTITLRDDPMANKVDSHFLIQNKIQVLGLHWPSPAKGWRQVKCYKLAGELHELFSLHCLWVPQKICLISTMWKFPSSTYYSVFTILNQLVLKHNFTDPEDSQPCTVLIHPKRSPAPPGCLSSLGVWFPGHSLQQGNKDRFAAQRTGSCYSSPSRWHCSWKGNFFSVAKSFLMGPSSYSIWCNASHEISWNLLPS